MRLSIFAGTLLFAGLFSSFVLLGSAVDIFIDPPSLGFVFGGTFALVCVAFGPMELGRSVGHVVGLSSSERAASVWLYTAAAGLGTGVLGSLVGLVHMLQAMDDPAQLGPALALSLLSTLYGGGIGLFSLALGLWSARERGGDGQFGIAMGGLLGVLLWGGAGISSALLAYTAVFARFVP